MPTSRIPSAKNPLRVLSIHWGFTIGGMAKYAALVDKVGRYAPIDIKTVCILCPTWLCDRATLSTLAPKFIFVKSRFDVSWMQQVSSEIRHTTPNLIMTHGSSGHFVAMVMTRLLGHNIPIICSYHGLYHAPTRARKLLEKAHNFLTEHYIKKYTIGVVSVTNYSRQYLEAKGVTAKKIDVIHNGIDTIEPISNEIRQRVRREWNIKANEIILGLASRLDPVKGIVHLIDAFSSIESRNPLVKLVIVGTGNQREELQRHVSRLGLTNRVLFTGFRSDVDACLSAFDIFVLPSLAEYHSIALLEAMRAKKPIIATSVGGNVESVNHEREALLVPPADVDALGHAIQRLLTDNGLRKDLARAAHERYSRNFTTETMVQKTADWIMRCGRWV